MSARPRPAGDYTLRLRASYQLYRSGGYSWDWQIDEDRQGRPDRPGPGRNRLVSSIASSSSPTHRAWASGLDPELVAYLSSFRELETLFRHLASKLTGTLLATIAAGTSAGATCFLAASWYTSRSAGEHSTDVRLELASLGQDLIAAYSLPEAPKPGARFREDHADREEVLASRQPHISALRAQVKPAMEAFLAQLP